MGVWQNRCLFHADAFTSRAVVSSNNLAAVSFALSCSKTSAAALVSKNLRTLRFALLLLQKRQHPCFLPPAHSLRKNNRGWGTPGLAISDEIVVTTNASSTPTFANLFLCHTSAKCVCNSNHCHTSKNKRLKVPHLPHIRKRWGVSPWCPATHEQVDPHARIE